VAGSICAVIAVVSVRRFSPGDGRARAHGGSDGATILLVGTGARARARGRWPARAGRCRFTGCGVVRAVRGGDCFTTTATLPFGSRMKGLGGVLAVTTNGRLDGLGRSSLPRRDIFSRECTLQLKKVLSVLSKAQSDSQICTFCWICWTFCAMRSLDCIMPASTATIPSSSFARAENRLRFTAASS
jgi:hypothetical protein